MDIVEFLTARLDEDEAAAQAAAVKAAGSPVYGPPDTTGKWRATNDGIYADTAYGNGPFAIDGYGFLPDEIGNHIARHDPARVLREVAAKRAIAELHGPDQVDYINADGDSRDSVDCKTCDPGGSPDTWPCDTLKLLAAAYADHPDYDESWRS